MNPKQVIAMARENEAKFVDLRFMDLPVMWQHVTVPVERLTEDRFEDGLGFDGFRRRRQTAQHHFDHGGRHGL